MIKKNLTYSVFLVLTVVYLIFIGNSTRYILPTSSLPVAEHTIVLDAGHGQPDRTVL